MAVKRCESNIDVVKAAEIRIKNVFGNGLPGVLFLQWRKRQLVRGTVGGKSSQPGRDRYEAAYSAVHR